jgi:hypothetical protein
VRLILFQEAVIPVSTDYIIEFMNVKQYPSLTKHGLMETVCFSETLVSTFETTWCHNLEKQHQHLHHHERLKYSKVKPLYRKGEKSCISNFRPISLLTAFSKIFEKVTYDTVTF